MSEAAMNIYKELLTNHVINQALSQCPDADIVVTGHSLGAGTATILGFILRVHHPNTYVYSYGPPGGLLNEAAQKEAEKFIVSVVCGDDFISRLSINSIFKLRTKMEEVLLQCNYPKHKILNWALSSSLTRCLCCFCCLGKREEGSVRWSKRLAKAKAHDFSSEETEFNNEETLDQSVRGADDQRRNSSSPILSNDSNDASYGSTYGVEGLKHSVSEHVDTLVVIESEIVNEAQPKLLGSNEGFFDSTVALENETKECFCECNQRLKTTQNQISGNDIPEMYPPGKIVHLVCGHDRNTWHIRYVNVPELSEIKISEYMATDHFPQEYINGLTYVSSHLINNTVVHI